MGKHSLADLLSLAGLFDMAIGKHGAGLDGSGILGNVLETGRRAILVQPAGGRRGMRDVPAFPGDFGDVGFKQKI